MARYEQSYSGEHRSAALHVQLTPGERAELESAARQAGAASLSAYVRQLCLRRVLDAGRVAGVRRHPDALLLARELNAVGNNLNQLARIANATGVVPAADELRATIGLLKAVFARVIAL